MSACLTGAQHFARHHELLEATLAHLLLVLPVQAGRVHLTIAILLGHKHRVDVALVLFCRSIVVKPVVHVRLACLQALHAIHDLFEVVTPEVHRRELVFKVRLQFWYGAFLGLA